MMARGVNKVGTVLGTMEFGRGPCTGNVPQTMANAFLSCNENTQKEINKSMLIERLDLHTKPSLCLFGESMYINLSMYAGTFC